MSITVSPLRRTVSEGGVATFTARGSGIKTREFEYQWLAFREKRSVITVVGMNRQLMINNSRIEDGRYYYCSVTNQWNKIKYSKTATLTVIGKIQDYA